MALSMNWIIKKGVNMKTLLGVLISIVFLGISAQADQVLGSTTIDRHGFMDVDTIVLNPAVCGLREIQMQITQRPARIDSLSVQYADGRWDVLDVHDDFYHGEVSRWYGLRDGSNCVRKIAVAGDSKGLPFKKALATFVGR
jgi:hypothetical protein